MKREAYQTAFSKLAPSPEAVEKVLSAVPKRTARPKLRAGAVLLAAVLAAALLTGAVFGAVRMNRQYGWFTLGGGENAEKLPPADPERIGETEQLPPQSSLEFDVRKGPTQVGFRLPQSYETGKWGLECRYYRSGEAAGAYQRYYRNPDPSDPASPLLTVQILDADRDRFQRYFTRFSAQTVKQDNINDMETVWIKIENSYAGVPQYVLFQFNEELGCIAVAASTSGFADAEQAVADLTYVDTGIPIPAAENKVRYGMTLGWIPEDMSVDSTDTLDGDRELINAVLEEPHADLSTLLQSARLVDPKAASIGDSALIVSVDDNVDRFVSHGPIEAGTVYKTGTLGGMPARWVRTERGVYIQVYSAARRVQLEAFVGKDAADTRIEDAERVLESVVLTELVIVEDPPIEFFPFVVG